jgi:hypothetical protein
LLSSNVPSRSIAIIRIGIAPILHGAALVAMATQR